MLRRAVRLFAATAWLAFGLNACGDEASGPQPPSDSADAQVDTGDTLDAPDAADTLAPEDSAAPVDTESPPADTLGPEEVTEPADTVPPADITPPTDTTPVETWPRAGFGAISGACDQLDTELTDPAPSFFVNHIDFGADPYDDEDLSLLTPGGQTIMTTPNAGGSSVPSEAFAFELLARCEGAALLKTETQVVYDVTGKMTDILVRIDGLKIGVSVVRAVGFPKDAPYTVAQAETILDKKLSDILVSSANVAEEDAWVKQVLHVIAYDAPHVDALRTAWEGLPAATRADTVVIVTVSDGDDAFLY